MSLLNLFQILNQWNFLWHLKRSIILLRGQNANLLKQIAKINTYIHTYIYIYTLHNKILKKFPTIVLSLLKVVYMNDESIYNILAITSSSQSQNWRIYWLLQKQKWSSTLSKITYYLISEVSFLLFCFVLFFIFYLLVLNNVDNYLLYIPMAM